MVVVLAVFLQNLLCYHDGRSKIYTNTTAVSLRCEVVLFEWGSVMPTYSVMYRTIYIVTEYWYCKVWRMWHACVANIEMCQDVCVFFCNKIMPVVNVFLW